MADLVLERLDSEADRTVDNLDAWPIAAPGARQLFMDLAKAIVRQPAAMIPG